MMIETGARVIHLQIGTSDMQLHDDGAIQYHIAKGFAIVSLHRDKRLRTAYQFLMVQFRLTPGGDLKEGDIEITGVNVMTLDADKNAVDNIGEPLNRMLLSEALREALRADIKWTEEYFAQQNRSGTP